MKNMLIILRSLCVLEFYLHYYYILSMKFVLSSSIIAVATAAATATVPMLHKEHIEMIQTSNVTNTHTNTNTMTSTGTESSSGSFITYYYGEDKSCDDVRIIIVYIYFVF